MTIPLTWKSGEISRLWSASVISKAWITLRHIAIRLD